MKILLLGGSGRTGREIIRRALDAGDRVTVTVRNENQLSDIRHEQFEIRVGCPYNSEFLTSIISDHDLLISTLGPRWPSKKAAAIYSSSASAIIDAMQAKGVKRLLVTSSALHFPAKNLLDKLLKRFVRNIVIESGLMEEKIRMSNLDWTIVRPGFLSDRPEVNYRAAIDELPKNDKALSRAALAEFLLKTARQSSYVREVIGICR